MRAWRLFQDAAFVGMTSLSYQSSQVKVGDRQQCAFPALQAVIAAAATKDEGKEIGDKWEGSAALVMVEDLAKAWKVCVQQTKQAFPASQRKPGSWGKPWPGQRCCRWRPGGSSGVPEARLRAATAVQVWLLAPLDAGWWPLLCGQTPRGGKKLSTEYSLLFPFSTRCWEQIH